MRVLAGGPARETSSDLYALHVEGLKAQGWPTGVYRATASVSERIALGVPPDEPDPPTPVRFDVSVHHEIVPDPGGPRWSVEKIERVAKARQAMFGYVREGLPHDHSTGFDALLMVDTDCILGPGVLERMWACDADVVFGTFWTRADWGNVPGIDVWPQVWDRHSYRFTEECWRELTAPGVNEVEVYGGGACTLIRGRGFESHYWPLLESLSAYDDMMVGEDRSYCLGLEARGITMKAVTGLPIVHLYTPELRTPAMLEKAREKVGLSIGAGAH